MKSSIIYDLLEKDFILPGISDDWGYMSQKSQHLCENFKKRSMGLVYDFANDINKAFTAVFPSDSIMERIINSDAKNAMLFVHHPMNWDARNEKAFSDINVSLAEIFKENNISIYNLHSPLDNYGKYSTSNNLSKGLGFKVLRPFAEYCGGLAGVISSTEANSLSEIKEIAEKSLGHSVKLYRYGSDSIDKDNIAVVAGGGLDEGVIRELIELNIKTLVTGVTLKNAFTQNSHKLAIENHINIIGCTHYSTEKFACMEMVKYFEKLGLESEFLSDEAILEDL